MNFVLLIIVFLFGWVLRSFFIKAETKNIQYQNIAQKVLGPLARGRIKRQREKEDRKSKVLVVLKGQGRITNDDVEKLVNVSHSTATRYLDELEQEGKIIQKGTIGQSVYYVLKGDE